MSFSRKILRLLGIQSLRDRVAEALEQDPATLQAQRDQQTADYPYCQEGCMACRSLCDCDVRDMSGFVAARARLIREGWADWNSTEGNLQPYVPPTV